MQGQEVACVIAEDPYVAHDALELIEVDYDPLPVVISPQAALDPTAPLIRDDKEGQTDNKVYHWRPASRSDEKGVRRGRQGRPARPLYPRCHPAPLLRRRRRWNPGHGQGDDLHDLAGASRAPDGVRARRRPAGAEHPDHLAGHRRRVRQQGAGVPRPRRRHRGAAAGPAGEVDRRPHRQPDLDRLRARLLHGRRARADRRRDDDRAPREDALRPGLFVRGCAAVEVQGGPVPHRHRLLRHPGRARRHRGRVHEQGARRRRLPVLVPGHRGVVLHRAARPDGRVRAGDRSRRAAAEELHPAGQAPTRPRRASNTTPATTSRRSTRRWNGSATRSCARSGSGRARRGVCSGSASRASPRSSEPARADSSTSSGSRCSTPPSCVCTPRERRF